MIYMVENDRTQKYFIVAKDEKEALDIYSDTYSSVRDITWVVCTLPEYLSTTDTPEKYVMERVREDILDWVITEMRAMLTEKYGDIETTDDICMKATNFAIEHMPDPEPPYDIEYAEIAKQLLLEMEIEV